MTELRIWGWRNYPGSSGEPDTITRVFQSEGGEAGESGPDVMVEVKGQSDVIAGCEDGRREPPAKDVAGF